MSLRSESSGFSSEVCSDFSGKTTDRAAAQSAVAFFGKTDIRGLPPRTFARALFDKSSWKSKNLLSRRFLAGPGGARLKILRISTPKSPAGVYGHEICAYMADNPVSEIHISAQKALLPVHADLLAVRDRGCEGVGSDTRAGSCCVENTALQSVRSRRHRPCSEEELP